MKYIITFMFLVSIMIIPINSEVLDIENHLLSLFNQQAEAFFTGKEIRDGHGNASLVGNLDYTLYKTDAKSEATFFAKSNVDDIAMTDTEGNKYYFYDDWKDYAKSKFYFNFVFSVPNSEKKLYGTFDDEDLPSKKSNDYKTTFVKSALIPTNVL